MKGEKVIGLQRYLKEIGYWNSVNGVFDRTTQKVVKAFQSHYRRHQVTGEVDLETLLRIKDLQKK